MANSEKGIYKISSCLLWYSDRLNLIINRARHREDEQERHERTHIYIYIYIYIYSSKISQAN